MYRTRIAIAGLALFATACTSGGATTGTPTPGTDTGSATPTSTSSAAGNNSLASVKPCDLISSSEASELGITSPTPHRTGGSETCEWKGTNRGGLIVSLNPDQGADALNFSGDTKKSAKFGKYEGFTVPAPQGGQNLCDAVIAVSKSSSVQLVGQTSLSAPDTAKACELATKSAEFVATKLS